MKRLVIVFALCAAVWAGLAVWLLGGKSPSDVHTATTAAGVRDLVQSPPPEHYSSGGTAWSEARQTASFPAYSPVAGSYSGRLQAALDSGDAKAIDEAIVSILPDWMAADPGGALRYIAGLHPGDQRDMVLSRAIGFWAMRDPAAAMQSASAWPNRDEGRKLMSIVCIQQAQTNPQAAFSAAESSGVAAADSAVESQLFGKYVQKDAHAAMSWALSQQQGSRRNQLIRMAAVEQGTNDPFGAAQTILNQIPKGSDQDGAMSSLMSRFAGGSIMDDSAQHASTAINLLQIWAARNPDAASAWVRQLTPDHPLYARASAAVQSSAQ